MSSFMFSDLLVLGQIGTTIGLGLLFDTLIVRSFMTPSIAALLGRWFWWPQRVRPRPASTMLRPYGPRSAVRQLLLWEDPEESTVESAERLLLGDDRVTLALTCGLCLSARMCFHALCRYRRYRVFIGRRGFVPSAGQPDRTP